MKHLFTAAAMLFSMTAFAQVGINNTSPKATLDITAKTTDGSKSEGLIIPQLSGSNIHTATAAGVYGINQKGLIIYATSADSSPTSATANITAAGYYYFDGTNWQKIITGSVANADLTTGTGGIYKGSGALSGNTTVTQGANTLAFTSTATNGFSVDGTTLSVDAANNRVGIGTSTPAVALDINSSTSGAIKIKDGTEADGKVLVSDANGVGTWKNPSSTSGTLIYSGAVTTRYVPGSTYIRVDLGSVPANVWDKVYNAAGRAYIIAKNIALGYIHQTTVWAIGDRNNFQTYGFFFNDVYWSTFNSSTSTWQYQASRAPLPDFIEIYIF